MPEVVSGIMLIWYLLDYLLTYAGQGTELLPNYAKQTVSAFYRGKPNSEIIKDKSARKFINKWDIAVFRGGRNGIPPSELQILHCITQSIVNINAIR